MSIRPDNAPTEIRLTVEAMKYQVIHAFHAHTAEVEAEIGRAVEAALKNFDFTAVVKEEAEKLLRDAVKRAIASAASAIMYEEPLYSLVKEAARKKVRQAIEESLKRDP